MILAATVLGVGLSAQENVKPFPAPREHHTDWKSGPAEPWIPSGPVPERVSRASDELLDAAPVRSARGPFEDPGAILFDEPSAELMIVAAADYKAQFAAGTATVAPFLGSQATRNWPLAMRLAAVDVAGAPMPIAAAPTPVRSGDLVTFDHGAVSVRYAARAEGVEQSFLFDVLPRRGEIVIHVAVDTDLQPVTDGTGLRFLGPEGGVGYGDAVAIDGRGRRLALQRRYIDGEVEIVVPASFVEEAAMPLLVDPLVRRLTVAQSPSAARIWNSDITFDSTTNRYMVCFEYVFSAADSDVYSYELDSGGTVVANSYAVIDSNMFISWRRPRVANNNLANRNLVVAEVSVANVSPFTIQGRMRNAGSTTTGSVFTISSTSVGGNSGDKICPDVGGDPHTTGPTYFTVVWERVYTSSDHDIHARQVSNGLNPTLLGTSELLIDNGGGYEIGPVISNSAGAPDPSAAFQKWMIVYARGYSEIRGRFIRWDGALDNGFLVHSGDGILQSLSVSSPTRPIEGEHVYLVGWHKFVLGVNDSYDIYLRPISQRSMALGPSIWMRGLENPGGAIDWDTRDPRIATDGCRFVVAYTESYNNGPDQDVRVTTFHTRPGLFWTLAASESRVAFGTRGSDEYSDAICSRYDGSDPSALGSVRYVLTWTDYNGTGNDQIWAGLYDGRTPGADFQVLTTGCGVPTITYSGSTALGMQMTIASLANYLMVGFPQSPVPLCRGSSCALGIAGQPGLLPPVFTITVPCDSGLLGVSLAFQGLATTGGPCFGGLSVTDTVVTTFR